MKSRSTPPKKHPSKQPGALIKSPTAKDILFGRGGLSNKAEGNKHYQEVIEQSSGIYGTLKGRNAKTRFAWKVYQELQAQGVRFLRKDRGGKHWRLAPEDECRKKISQRLRERVLECKREDDPIQGAKAAVSEDGDKEEKEEECCPCQSLEELDDVSISVEDVVPATDFSELDDSIDSLLDFLEYFPASWIKPPSPPNVPSAPSGGGMLVPMQVPLSPPEVVQPPPPLKVASAPSGIFLPMQVSSLLALQELYSRMAWKR